MDFFRFFSLRFSKQLKFGRCLWFPHWTILRIGDRDLKPMVTAQPQAYVFFGVGRSRKLFICTVIIHDTFVKRRYFRMSQLQSRVRFKVSHGSLGFVASQHQIKLGGSSLRPGNESHCLCLVLSEGPGRRNSMQGTKALFGDWSFVWLGYVCLVRLVDSLDFFQGPFLKLPNWMKINNIMTWTPLFDFNLYLLFLTENTSNAAKMSGDGISDMMNPEEHRP